MEKQKISPMTTDKEKEAFGRVLDILHHLRSPEGCPWDKKQTMESIRSHILEEPSELVEAIHAYMDAPNEKMASELREEFGDVFLVLSMAMLIYQDEEKNALHTILSELAEKLVRRHPHVFDKENSSKNPTSKDLSQQWQDIKVKQEGKSDSFSQQTLSSFHPMLDTLERCKKVQKKLQKNKKELLSSNTVQKTLEELTAKISVLKQIPKNEEKEQINYEAESLIGALLYQVVSLSYIYKVSPASSLLKHTEKHPNVS